MKLVENGNLGIYVDTEHLKTLMTVDAIDAELDALSLGEIEPVYRDNDTVVDAKEYAEFLKARRLEIEAAQKVVHAKPITVPNDKKVEIDLPDTHDKKVEINLSDTPDKGDTDLEIDLALQLQHKDDIIARLLAVAKNAKVHEKTTVESDGQVDKLESEQTNKMVFYTGEIPEGGKGTMAIKPPLRGILLSIMGVLNIDSISEVGNTIIARGLLGDVRAKDLIDDIYGDGHYDKIIESFGDA